MKKLLTLFAALAMVMALFVAPALADDDDDEDERDRTESVYEGSRDTRDDDDDDDEDEEVETDEDDRDDLPTIYEIARDASDGRWAFDRNGGDFDILVAALKLTGLDAAVDDEDADLTVFAPTDATFQATFGGSNEIATLIKAFQAVGYDIGTLRTVLLYHVTDLNLDAEKGLSAAEVGVALAGSNPVSVPMLAGADTSVSAPPLAINGSPIVATDLFASNGVIHVIGGSVLLP